MIDKTMINKTKIRSQTNMFGTKLKKQEVAIAEATSTTLSIMNNVLEKVRVAIMQQHAWVLTYTSEKVVFFLNLFLIILSDSNCFV